MVQGSRVSPGLWGMEAFSLLHTWPAPTAGMHFYQLPFFSPCKFHHAVRSSYLSTNIPAPYLPTHLGTYPKQAKATVPSCNRYPWYRSSHISPHPVSFLISSFSASPYSLFSCSHFHLPPSRQHHILSFSTRVLPSPDRDLVICPTLEPAQKAVTGGQSCKHTARDYTVSTTPG